MIYGTRMITCFISRRLLIRLLDQCTVQRARSFQRIAGELVCVPPCILYLSIRVHAFPLHAPLRGVSAIGLSVVARCVNIRARTYMYLEG